MKPQARVLLVGDEPGLAGLVAALGAAAARRTDPFGLRFAVVADAAGALAEVARDGAVQTVLVDAAGGDAARELPARLKAFRPELSLYAIVPGCGGAGFDDAPLDGVFRRDAVDAAGWCRTLSAGLAEKSATPFYDALRRYVAMAKDSWHTPGHSGGDSFRGSPWVGDFHDFVGENLLRADLSVSVPTLDSLLAPTGVIARAQALAAEAFGARATFFVTNGSSTSNKVILQTLLAPGDVLLLDRNCHKSVHHGVILSGARPVYLPSTPNHRYGLFGPLPRRVILDAIDAHPKARALMLTSCTYDGLRYDLAPLVEAAHARGIKVVVDEAWYTHGRFHPALRPTALEAGADYVTHSTHKGLSALSQAAMVHVNDPGFDARLFRENFNMFASTSPQYALIASLDVARRQAVMEGYTLLSRALAFAAELRERIDATGVFRVLTLDDLVPAELAGDGVRLDPTKLTVDVTPSGLPAEAVRAALFGRFNIQVEKTTHNTITFLVSLGSTRAKLERLADALAQLARERRRAAPLRPLKLAPLPGISPLACLPRDAFFETGERVPLLVGQGSANPALLGRVSCDQVVPYPPGIPVLVPGQRIDAAVLDYLARLVGGARSVEVHGLDAGADGATLRVLSADEERVRTEGSPEG
ncbi:arginine decarboxylase [Crenobacter luteus]|uniref:aminotransferase class I/II-fold pyridoxal phosphate-dependent enzyme n=1 Tax=Crenobacter luteus TaxID=1452487 RepID=UPI0010533BDF|nr:aminotransferase class I/II-fold pyridoxal phosphate-dependent enzyme [Crenobacter luteus]TCP10331.1 arginine decarboxylase [Crenobacter luteus]